MSFVTFTEFQVRYENTVPAADEVAPRGVLVDGRVEQHPDSVTS